MAKTISRRAKIREEKGIGRDFTGRRPWFAGSTTYHIAAPKPRRMLPQHENLELTSQI
jgi:hypothetical protein